MKEKLSVELSVGDSKVKLSNLVSKETLEKYNGSDIYEKAISFLIDNLKIECISVS